MGAVRGEEFAAEVCRTLGLDIDVVRDITIRIPASGVINVTVDMFVRHEDVEGLVDGFVNCHGRGVTLRCPGWCPVVKCK